MNKVPEEKEELPVQPATTVPVKKNPKEWIKNRSIFQNRVGNIRPVSFQGARHRG